MLDTILLTALVVNTITFLAFGLDKWKASRDWRRVPEAWLLVLAFATGLFGAWLGMSVFRHKTQKRSFKLKLWLVSVCNVLWVWLWWWWRREG